MKRYSRITYVMITMLLLMVAGCGDDRTERLPGDDMIRVTPQVFDLSNPARGVGVFIEFAPFNYTGDPYEDGTGAFWVSAEAEGTLSGADGAGRTLSFDFEDGVAECWYIPTNMDETVTVYAAAGAYPYDIIASARIYVVNQVLNANFQYAVTGLSVNYDNLSQPSSLGGALTYAWDFGDGTVSALENPSHTYAAAGTYFVELIVTEGAMTDTVQYSVTVAAP